MNECYYYLLLLLLNIFSNIQYSLSNEKDFSIQLSNLTIQHVCENDLLFIKCFNINETIQIIRSMYGRTSQRICNQDLTYRFFEKTCANIEQSKYQTKFHCQGKSTCQILINNHLFNDPCGLNIPKHFEVHYRCINREEICMKLFINCSKINDLKCIEHIQEEFSCQCPSNICQYDINNQLIGFIEHICPEEYLQGFYWKKTLINQSEYLSCPSPCTGEISRFCNSNSQWSKPNYTNCECPIKQSDQLSTHRSANSYVFQCNFWLINRILPKENSCILSFTNWKDEENLYNNNDNNKSLNCLLRAFQQMTFQSCLISKSFGIDFQNLGFEIFIPEINQSHFQFLSNQIHIDRTKIIKEYFRMNLPMMIIETKNKNSKNKSIILIEQENDLNSIQTANVTITFNHQSSEYRYQCRAYHSTNFSLHVDSLNMFFACQLLCSNGSHVICQCPFFNPFMHYILYIDTLKTKYEIMIENDLNEKCFKKNNDTNQIDQYLRNISSINFAKKLLLLIDRRISKENLFTNWKIFQQIEYLALRLINQTNSFSSINHHIDFFIKSKEFHMENHDQSVLISIMEKINFPIMFFTLSNIKTSQLFNSQILNINFLTNKQIKTNIQIIFHHLNQTNQNPICVYLKTNEKNDIQWSKDGCQLLSTNLTHSICSCNHHLNTFALLIENSKSIIKSNENHLLFIPKFSCIISIICLLLTIILLIITRFHMKMNDDLTIVRNILHTNIFLCLMIVEILFLFGIDRIKTKIICRIISILIDYFLLSTYSWMFIDGIELLIALKHIFKIDRIRLIVYSLYSYGFPLLFVFLSSTLSIKNGNDLNQFCWLSHDTAFIWAFIIPFILIIFGNFCFFLISIYSICKQSNISDQKNQIRFSLRDISLISILFGLTWIIALFYLNNQTIFLGYLFAIFNSFHGLLILIFYCLLEKSLRNFFQKFSSIERFSLPDNTSSSEYSSGHSSDINNKQILSNQIIDFNRNYTNQILFRNHYEKKSYLNNNETLYLPSIPINLLTNRLSTFRYPLSTNEMILTQEQNQQLIEKKQIHEDEHGYYEIR